MSPLEKALSKEDEAKEQAAKCKIQMQAFLYAADMVMDVKVGIEFCTRGMFWFGFVLLAIPVVSGLLCFLYKFKSWELAPYDHEENGRETKFFYEKRNILGQKRPGIDSMLLQMLQLEGLVTAKLAYYDPRFRESWKIERAFNGLVESFPSCLIQAYTLLCMAQLGHLDEVWNTIWQVFSIMLSCHSMAAAVKLVSFRLLPGYQVLPVQSSPMQMPQLTLLLICDVSARVFCFAAFGLCFRPAVRMSENRQFALPLLMLAELAVVVWLTTRFLNKRWFHSVENTRDAVLSTTISYFTIPALALHTQSNDAVVDFSGMMKLQRVMSYGRAAELFVTLCLVWYHCHIQVYASRVYIRIFALWSLLGLACVLITRAFDRASRHEGRPILPAVGSQGFSPAHWACALDNVDLLRKLDEKEDVMDAPDENFRHPVHIAALYGREDALRVLHKVNATCIMAKDQAGWTPAHCAAHIGHEKVLELLFVLDPKCIQEPDEKGRTPAHCAAQSGHAAVLTLLHRLAPGSLAVKATNGAVPAHMAAARGQVEVLDVIKELCVDSLNKVNKKGALCAHKAAHHGHVKVLELLHDTHPESLKARNHHGKTPAHNAAHNGHEEVLCRLHAWVPTTLSAQDKDGTVPAHWPAHNGNLAVLKRLKLLASETLKMRNNEGWAPAHMAARNGHIEVLEFLLQEAPESLRHKSNHGWVPAHLAASRGHDAVLAMLKEKAEDTLAAQADDQAIPAHAAAAQGRCTTLELLEQLAPGCLRARDRDGRVPAHYAAEQGQANALVLLAKLAPETLIAKAGGGVAPAHTAALHGQEEALTCLQQSCPESLAATDDNGAVPAHMAAHGGYPNVLGLLKEWVPESLKCPDKLGRVPAHDAAEGGHEEALKYLHWVAPESLGVKDNEHEWTPAHAAAANKRGRVLDMLREWAAESLEIADKDGYLPDQLLQKGGNRRNTMRVTMRPSTQISMVMSVKA
ncbi:unnamed protein product [Effrenium voratum]|nr:unnamed protein product [Effrenium voratum]